MSEKPNISAIATYSKKYAAKLCEDFFEDNEHINGKQLVQISDVQQVNLLIVEHIYQAWQNETSKLISPYFDYSADDVILALQNFMNTLSKNISITRENFEPLLVKATYDTLIYLFDPQSFFEDMFEDMDKKISIDHELKPRFKYLTLHKKIVTRILTEFEEEGKMVKKKRAIKIIEEVVEANQGKQDDPQEIIQTFHETIPVGIFELAPNWKQVDDAEEEDDGLSEDTSSFQYESEEEEIKSFEKEFEDLDEEIKDEFKDDIDSNELDGEDGEEEDDNLEDEIDHLKNSLDPINDNVFLSNQDEDFGDTDLFDDPISIKTNNPYLGATSDMEVPKFDEEPLHDELDDDDDEIAEQDELELYSIEEAYEEKDDSLDLFQEEIEETTPEDREFVAHETEQTVAVAEPEVAVEEESTPEPEVKAPVEENEPEPATLLDKLSQKVEEEEDDDPKTILDRIRSKATKQLKGTIPLHMKFKFQNDLFNGDSDKFNEAIELIDQAPDYHEALALIKSRYVLNYNWDFSNETTLEFISLVEDKYDD